MRLEIRLYGDPVLRKRAREVTDFGPKLAELVEDLFETMEEENGAGLAAPQVGILQRVYVFNEYGESDDEGVSERVAQHVFVNPVITSRRGAQKTLEGCLSIPGLRFDGIDRDLEVTVEYQDMEGEKHEMTAHGYLAQTILHEQDHLDGVLYLDRLGARDRREFMDEHREELAEMQRYAKKQLAGKPG